MNIASLLTSSLLFASVAFAAEVHDAAEDGNLARLSDLLKSNPAQLELRNTAGMTPLHLAAREGKAEAVKFLIDKGADILALTKTSYDALSLATLNAQKDVISLLLEKGAIPTSQNIDGDTAITLAERAGKQEVLQLFKARGYDVKPNPSPSTSTVQKPSAENPISLGNLEKRYGKARGIVPGVDGGKGKKLDFIIWDDDPKLTMTAIQNDGVIVSFGIQKKPTFNQGGGLGSIPIGDFTPLDHEGLFRRFAEGQSWNRVGSVKDLLGVNMVFQRSDEALYALVSDSVISLCTPQHFRSKYSDFVPELDSKPSPTTPANARSTGSAAAPASANSNAKKLNDSDLTALQGRWQEGSMTIHTAEGTFTSPKKGVRTWTFSDDQQSSGDGKEWNRVKLDRYKDVKRITLTPMLGGGSPVSYAYTLSGDRLKIESAPLTQKGAKPRYAPNTADIAFEFHRVASSDISSSETPTNSSTLNIRPAGRNEPGAKEQTRSPTSDATKREPGSKPLVVNGETFWVRPAMQDALAPELAAQESRRSKWPQFSGELKGSRELRVKNLNEFSVKVGVRSGVKGRDFTVNAGKTASVFVPDGDYRIFFTLSSDPESVYQGDDFSLKGYGAEIQIVKVVNGNFNIRKVR